MNLHLLLKGKLVRRYLFLFFALGLIPILAILAIPLISYPIVFNIETVPSPLALLIELLGVSGLAFLLVMILGGWITYRYLALPIQELAKGTRLISSGLWSYRIPDMGGGEEISHLVRDVNRMAEIIEADQLTSAGKQAAMKKMMNHRDAEFEVIAQVANLHNQHLDLSAKLTKTLELTRTITKTDMLAIFLINPSKEFVLAASHCDQEDCAAFWQHCLDMPDLPLLRSAVHSGEITFIPDTKAPDLDILPAAQAAYSRLNVRKIGYVPILWQNEILGVILLMRHNLDDIQPETASFMGTLTDHIAILIENSRHKTELRNLAILEERRRLASDLHDSATQSLFSIGMAAESLRSSLPGDAAPQPALDIILGQTAVLKTELRSLINELRPLDLQPQERIDYALKRHANSLQELTRAQVSLDIQGDIRHLSEPVQNALNRIAQEAISNIARHSCASLVEILLLVSAEGVELHVKDNGVGYDPAQPPSSKCNAYGLLNMHERAVLAGGSLDVVAAPGQGAEIVARLPLQGAKENSLDE